jgi:hypothetical protein
MQSCLYTGRVFHQRLRPTPHRLAYRVMSLLIDLDELPILDRQLRLLGYNAFSLFGFQDGDHGRGDGSGLRPWVEDILHRAGIDLEGGAIRLLSYPRVLGYVFNPLSVFFCYGREGDLAAILYEVNNTFGQRHSYLIPTARKGTGTGIPLRQRCEKKLYVSPFIAVEGRYDFRIVPPGDTVDVVVNYSDEEGVLLHASFRAKRRPLTDRSLLIAFFRYPLMTMKVIAGIHWEALRLWRKGVPIVKQPPPPAEAVTIVPSSPL